MSGARKHAFVPAGLGLSARLLVLTIFFVMLAEVLIYAPSIATFRINWLEERVAAAHLAILALEATPDQMVSETLRGQLLTHAGVHAIVLQKQTMRLLLAEEKLPTIDLEVRLGESAPALTIWDALVVLLGGGERVLRVLGPSPKEPGVEVEVVIDEAPLRAAMIVYSRNILVLSIIISVFTAALVYLALHGLMVRPMRRITEGVAQFARNPEDATAGVRPSGRHDEIGVAQTVLARMQDDLRGALRQKEHLAALGSAVTKINHDLRGILSTAVLLSDRLAAVEDPEVRRIAGPLLQAIDRAINLCTQTLSYARDAGPELHRSRFALGALVNEVGADLTAICPGASPLRNEVDPAHEVEADREQLYRVLANLARNAVEAGAETVSVTADNGLGKTEIVVSDNGPGLAPKARESLFRPFAGSAKAGGTGLGLVIARDVMRAHGGDIELVATGAEGTTFRLSLPTPH
ncbi:MAG: HAMP domain-containing sensor histidine kinase [Alphaproteobacteria bacterium]